jgi:hypothetical protein
MDEATEMATGSLETIKPKTMSRRVIHYTSGLQGSRTRGAWGGV